MAREIQARVGVWVLVALVTGCSSSQMNPGLFGEGGSDAGGVAGAAGAAGAGAGGVAGAAGDASEAGGDADAGACPAHMLDRGTYCIDDRPAIYVSGQQGAAVPWQNANDNCVIRGLRLCTEDERESSCGLVPYDNFCLGPANTWEWSAANCSAGQRISPCCAVVQGYGMCDSDETKLQSFHCCKDH